MKRDIANSIFLGVCSGLAKSSGINVVIIRLLFLLCLIMAVGCPLIIYLILAVVMPPEKTSETTSDTPPKKATKTPPDMK